MWRSLGVAQNDPTHMGSDTEWASIREPSCCSAIVNISEVKWAKGPGPDRPPGTLVFLSFLF